MAGVSGAYLFTGCDETRAKVETLDAVNEVSVSGQLKVNMALR